MSFLHKDLSEVTKEDLLQLIKNQVSESRLLDYKQELPEDTRDARKEFLADITAFANASGGEIIYGIEEERIDGKPTGIPKEITGINIANVDSLLLKYESLIRDGIAPRIYGLSMRSLDIKEDKKVLIIRIAKSLMSPHMVTLGRSHKFYIRNSVGRHLMDVSELRHAFLVTNGVIKQIKDWRLERVMKIASFETPVRLQSCPILILHLIPFEAISGELLIDPKEYYQKKELLGGLSTSTWSHRYNLDGFLTYDKFEDKDIYRWYLQCFRNGSIELADTYLLDHGDLPFQFIETSIIKSLGNYLKALSEIGIKMPLVITMSFVNVKGLKATNSYWGVKQVPIDRDDILLPEIILESRPDNIPSILKPIFDSMWNAVGLPGSISYDRQGNWDPQ